MCHGALDSLDGPGCPFDITDAGVGPSGNCYFNWSISTDPTGMFCTKHPTIEVFDHRRYQHHKQRTTNCRHLNSNQPCNLNNCFDHTCSLCRYHTVHMFGWLTCTARLRIGYNTFDPLNCLLLGPSNISRIPATLPGLNTN